MAVETSPRVTEEAIFVAGQWRLFWLKFRKHKVALASLWVMAALYLVAALAEFVAPFPPVTANARYTYARPQPIHLFDAGWRWSPRVDGLKVEVILYFTDRQEGL